MNIATLLANASSAFADAPALSAGTRRVHTYGSLQVRVASFAAGLRSMKGVRPGDRVAIVMKNSARYVELLWAVWHAGLCVVPINFRLHPKEVAFILRNCQVRCALVDVEMLESICAEMQGEDIRILEGEGAEADALTEHAPMELVSATPTQPAWLFYTSGTTGRPKGATLTHGGLLAMTLRYYADVDMVVRDDCIIHAAPLSHATGLYSLPHVAKASHQIIPESQGFDPGELIELVNGNNNVSFFTAPTMLLRLQQQAGLQEMNVGNIQTIFYGGAPMYLANLKAALAFFGPRMWQGYGQGESPNTITNLTKRMHLDDGHPDYLSRLASVGIARIGVEVRVLSEDGRICEPNEVGDIVCRSDVTMVGYWNNPGATAEALRDGWLHTGDVGSMDSCGFLTLKDRSKDVIISGGSNIYPREVEEALLTHPAVLEASVVGQNDPVWGEIIVAFVVLKKDRKATEAELDRSCLENIARFKRPKRYVFLSELPKSNYGKVLKTELRKLLADHPGQSV
jgi:long-chain acyl-CoA synthetase